MLNRKPKIGNCDECGAVEVPLYRTNSPKRCKTCFFKEKNERYAKNKEKMSKRKVTRPKKKNIAPVSKKRLEQLAKYRPIRDKYLGENPTCEVEGCDNPTTNLHHKAGRVGTLLYDERYFMACCSDCHPKRIHEDPRWAREMGYIIDVDNKR